MYSNKDIAIKTVSKFWSYFTEAIVILLTGVVFATIFIVLAGFFDEKSILNKILSKLAEASMFIAGAGLIGTVYIIFNQIRTNARVEKMADIEEIFCKDINKTFTKKTYFVME